jgi:hypothetical protein
VAFPNSNEIRHHAYSFSAPKRFEVPLDKDTSANPVLFDRPGMVVLGCNIHDWMLGYIYVADTPYFGKTDADGGERIEFSRPRIIEFSWYPRAAGKLARAEYYGGRSDSMNPPTWSAPTRLS